MSMTAGHDRQPDQTGPRRQPPRCSTVPWIDRDTDPASNLSGGASAPVASRSINLERVMSQPVV